MFKPLKEAIETLAKTIKSARDMDVNPIASKFSSVKKSALVDIKKSDNKTIKKNQKRVVKFQNIMIDLNKQLIFKNDNEYKINNTEKIILEKMINNPGKTFSREDIGLLIDLDKERSIDVIITRLRKKIEIDPKNPKFLQTIRGAGYVLWIE